MSVTTEVETDFIEAEPTAEGQIVVRNETAIVPPDDASAQIAIQMATAAIEMSRRKSGEIDVEALREIRGMAKELRDEARLQWFSRDMAAAQAEMQPVVKNAEVKLGEGKGGYKYADLAAIDDMLRPIRTKYGFSITSDREPRQGDGGGFVIKSTLHHRSGHYITASFPLPLDSGPGRNNLQASGSTDSYGRKYNALAFFDIVRKNADDDGVAGGGNPIGNDQAARLVQLVKEAGIAPGPSDVERRAQTKAWFAETLSYEVTAFTQIRQEDYARLARMLKSLADKAKEAAAEGMKV
jgi:ERF superfamily